MRAPRPALVYEYLPEIASGLVSWVDDCALFLFGYLVPRYCETVGITHGEEDEIWVVRCSPYCLNAVSKRKNGTNS